MVEIDYTIQLSRLVVPIQEQHLLSMKQMRERFEYLDNIIQTGRNIKPERVKLEETIKLRIAYMNMLMAIVETYGDGTLDEDSKFEKKEVVESARKKINDAESEANSLENINKYEVLSLKNGASIEEIEATYDTYLKKFKEKLDAAVSGNFTIEKEKLFEAERIFYQIKSAYEFLSNPEKKLSIDERAMINFETDRSSLYSKNSFAQISYIPESYLMQKKKINSNEVMLTHNSRGDQILITKTGTLGFGRFRQASGKLTYVDGEALYEYQIIKTYADPAIAAERKRKCQGEIPSRWDESNSGEIFTVYGDLNKSLLTSKTTGQEYKKYVVDVYLSNVNLEAAMEHNCGYIGEVGIDRETGEYRVVHGQDQLCLAYEFKEISKRNGKIGIPIIIALDKASKERNFKEEGEAK